MARKGVWTAVAVAIVAGAGVALWMSPEMRRRVLAGVESLTVQLSSAIGDYRERLAEAIEAGKQAAEQKERELETRLASEPEALGEEESPDYIV